MQTHGADCLHRGAARNHPGLRYFSLLMSDRPLATQHVYTDDVDSKMTTGGGEDSLCLEEGT